MNIVMDVNKVSDDGKTFLKVKDTTLKDHIYSYANTLTTSVCGGSTNIHNVMLVVQVNKNER